LGNVSQNEIFGKWLNESTVIKIKLSTFLPLALCGDEWSASYFSCFTPGERVPSTQWIGG